MALKGKKFSEEHKKKLSLSHRGERPWARGSHKQFNDALRKWRENGGIPWNKGLKEFRAKEKSHLWKGGITDKKRYKRERRIRKIGADGSHTNGEWELLKKQYGNICPSCKRKEPKIKLTEDHIIPLTKGGSDFIENIQPLCQSCNSKKYNKIIKYENTI